MDKAVLARVQSDDKQTLGHFALYDGIHKIFECVMLELEDENNLSSSSRIPAGRYRAVKHESPKFGTCFHILEVPGRSEILIHTGNYHTHSRGCQIIGKSFVDINGDGYNDVTHSKDTMNHLLHMTNGFWLTIIDEDYLLN